MHSNSSEPSEVSQPVVNRKLVLLALVLFIPMAIIWWPGCKQYPEVTSEESLRLMKLLYAACNTRDPDRLNKVEQGLQQATQEGKLSTKEQTAFQSILDLARQGNWEKAQKASFKFAQDQVRK